VKAIFILGRIAEAEKLTVTQQELAQQVYQMAATNQVPVEKFAKELQERDGYGEIQQQILSSKVLDFIHKAAQIEEVPAGTLSQPAPKA
jgi:trigger factor